MNNTIKIPLEEFASEVRGTEISFPKYATQIINLANQNAQGTRPKVVGQMSSLIELCPSNDYVEWGEWYLERYPDAIDEATLKIMKMIDCFKEVIQEIDENMVRDWVTDLVITKTFVGLKVQQGILRKISQLRGTSYRLAGKEEEAKGIDGFIGDVPVSIKPVSYGTKNMMGEEIGVKLIYYEKTKSSVIIDFSSLSEES